MRCLGKRELKFSSRTSRITCGYLICNEQKSSSRSNKQKRRASVSFVSFCESNNKKHAAGLYRASLYWANCSLLCAARPTLSENKIKKVPAAAGLQFSRAFEVKRCAESGKFFRSLSRRLIARPVSRFIFFIFALSGNCLRWWCAQKYKPAGERVSELAEKASRNDFAEECS